MDDVTSRSVGSAPRVGQARIGQQRVVPGPNQPAGLYPHSAWVEGPGGVIEMPPIDVPRTEDVRAKMVRVPGRAFTMGSDGRDGQSWAGSPAGPAHPRPVEPYDLDPTEVTVGEYLTASGESLAGDGIEPDVRAPDRRSTDADEGLRRALQVLADELPSSQ